MRMSQQEKVKSHGRIVASASRLVRERGLEGTSVGEVMQAAGMTHGGFYKHFESKEALLEAAIDAAFSEFIEALDRGEPGQAFAAYRARYLSEGHRNHLGLGCPVATVGQEIGRAPDGLKAVFGRGIRRVVNALARVMTGSAEAKEAAAFRELSMLVGAMVIARASDPATARDVLAACKRRPGRVQ
jgi:TetR/AcrR family transcriptional regulator, transcriptional repressor for nem operon